MSAVVEVLKSEPTMTAEGLMLAGTVLARMGRDRNGTPALVIDGGEERILALLALAYDRPIGPGVLGNIRRASNNWGNGEAVLAAIDLALGGLSPLNGVEAAALRLSLGDKLLSEGLSPRNLLKGCGLDPAPLDALKAGYNPLEPRIPPGNGRGSGDWTTADNSEPARPVKGKPQVKPATSTPAVVSYTPVHGLPDDAIVVTTSAGKTIPDRDSKTKMLMAPPGADYHKVFTAGVAISTLRLISQIPAIRAAVGQGGTYDFQRDPRTGLFHDAYTNASNYAVGVFMSGAGHSLFVTKTIAKGVRSPLFEQRRVWETDEVGRKWLARRDCRLLEIDPRLRFSN